MNKQVSAIVVLFVFLSSSLTIGFFQGGIISPAFSKKTNDDTVKTDTTTTSTTTTEKDKDKTTDPSTTTTDKTTKTKTPVKKEKSNTSNDNQTKTPVKKEKSNTSNDNQTEPTVQAFEAKDNTNKSTVDQTNTNQSIVSLSNTNTNGTDPLVCTSKDLLKCYFKLTIDFTLEQGYKYSDFVIHITENPRHIADFPGSKTSVKYLLPGNYVVSYIFGHVTYSNECVGNAKAGDSITCHIHSPPPPEQILHVAESVKFVNGSFATIPPVKVGTITVKGNNPHPDHFQIYSGDDEEGIEVKLGLGKYMRQYLCRVITN